MADDPLAALREALRLLPSQFSPGSPTHYLISRCGAIRYGRLALSDDEGIKGPHEAVSSLGLLVYVIGIIACPWVSNIY